MNLAQIQSAVSAARSCRELEVSGITRRMVDVSGIPGADRLPRALVVLLENVVRRAQTDEQAAVLASRILEAALEGAPAGEIEFMPARVLFQDFTGVPVFVDFAAMRDACVERGGDPKTINPRIPCTLVVDHSVAADCVRSGDAAEKNQDIEASRNAERFAFLKWASRSFDNVQIVPPGRGICHQLNIERFASVVTCDALDSGEVPLACFDTLVGTDSHTPTANGLGVLGWGVGGIEAEAAALGQPCSMVVPPVVELRLEGELAPGAAGMDLALTVAQRLRAEGVVGCLVEVTGEGVSSLTATQRACVSNMTPEYGATATLFPVDQQTIDYLLLTGRDPDQVAFARSYLEAQGMLKGDKNRTYSRSVTIDLSEVRPSLAGPSRPHDRLEPAELPARFASGLAAHGREGDHTSAMVACGGETFELTHGALAIAAVTSCTTATDPAMMVAAGLVARRANQLGLSPRPWVKTILAPGSRATTELLDRAGLVDDLAAMGFATCGYGCMSCIGNSGPILDCLKGVADELELTSVLSGNRNFEGRISPDVAQNYLCAPALVVAYSLAGTMDIDLTTTPVQTNAAGEDIFLKDLLPTSSEVNEVLSRVLTADVFEVGSRGLSCGSAAWELLDVDASDTYPWDEDSTYVRRAPYFEIARTADVVSVRDARVLALLGDFVTTDHISPAGAIASDSPAADYLRERAIDDKDFNTYGSRRGNHEVMERGTFANVKLTNALAGGRHGGWTRDLETGETTSIFAASSHYRELGRPLVILAGKMYGSGSSRDWAAKGPLLLGVSAVIAESFERIHRSNLVGMGIVPLEFADGATVESLGLDGTETITVGDIDLATCCDGTARVGLSAKAADGRETEFTCIVRVDTRTEASYLAEGGILTYVLNRIMDGTLTTS